MRRLATYIYQQRDWPVFTWDERKLAPTLAAARHQQGRLLGRLESLGFPLQVEATLEVLTQEVIKSSEIEGEILDSNQVRSSVARRLGLDIAGMVPSGRHVDGVVEMMIDATQRFRQPMTKKRLLSWHASLFPTGHSGMQRIIVGDWRKNSPQDPMQVVSGAMGKERVHYEAPPSALLPQEMKQFIQWFEKADNTDPLLRAGIAHLWFVTIHPFEDGNGRIARAITDMQLARADGIAQRFYSMSRQIRAERRAYYDILEHTQKGGMDITDWLEWFLRCLSRSLQDADQTLERVLRKARLWQKIAGMKVNDRQKMMLNKLLDRFEGKLTSSKWAKMTKCSQDTAQRDISHLIELGIVQRETSGGRSTNYTLVP